MIAHDFYNAMEDEPEKNASLELPAARAVLALVVFRALGSPSRIKVGIFFKYWLLKGDAHP